MKQTTIIIESKQVTHPQYGPSTVSVIDAGSMGLRLVIDTQGKHYEYSIPSVEEGRRLLAKLN